MVLLFEFAHALSIKCTFLPFLLISSFWFNHLKRNVLLWWIHICCFRLGWSESANWYRLLKWDLFAVVHTFYFQRSVYIYACYFQLSLFLKLGKSPGFFQLLFTGLSFGFLAFGVSKPSSAFLEHLFFIFVHINWIRTASLGLRIWINFSRSQTSRIRIWICTWIFPLCSIQ